MIQFPIDPALGQEYTQGDKTWKWVGYAWNLVAVPQVQVQEVRQNAAAAKGSAAAALVSENNSNISANAAHASQLASLASEIAAEAAEQAALASQLAAQASEMAAGISQADALASKNTAESAKDTAVLARDAAALSKTAAETASATAVQKAGEIVTAHTETLAASVLAGKWAGQLGTPVANGIYSARYYANEAKQYVDTIIVGQIQADWNEDDPASKAFIFNKPTFHTVAISGDYMDLINKPVLPTMISDLINDAGYLTEADLPADIEVPVLSVAGRDGHVVLTNADVGLPDVENKSSSTIRSELTPGNVTTALGFTPLRQVGVESILFSVLNGRLNLAVDATDFANIWPININGSATLLNNQTAAHYLDLANATGTLALSKGGTGATTAASARTQLGLGNVNNTADINKPISTAMQAALDTKANKYAAVSLRRAYACAIAFSN